MTLSFCSAFHYFLFLEFYDNFMAYPANEVTDLGVPYDTLSVMHYSGYAFSLDGQETIVPLPNLTNNPNGEMGQRIGLTEKDILKINIMYGCPLQ